MHGDSIISLSTRRDATVPLLLRLPFTKCVFLQLFSVDPVFVVAISNSTTSDSEERKIYFERLKEAQCSY